MTILAVIGILGFVALYASFLLGEYLEQNYNKSFYNLFYLMLIFSFLTAVEITFVIFFAQRNKYGAKTNKTILITHLITTFLMFIVAFISIDSLRVK